jgi:mono/diheme cytochrome c family protein
MALSVFSSSYAGENVPRTSKLFSAIVALFALALLPSLAMAATSEPKKQSLDGRSLFGENCAACHGADGRGDRKLSDLGFGVFNVKMPDFGDCSFANREADGDWASTIHRGGRARAFPRAMPAWDRALSDDEINGIIGYLRSKCEKSGWPRGEFNLPLAMFTEKAFPEDEVLNINELNTKGSYAFTSTTIFEKRFGKTGQLEVNLPISSVAGSPHTQTGIGDIGVAWKQNLLADVDQGTIFSALGEVVLPTGSAAKGLGTGSWAFETHALFAQVMDDYFLQGDFFSAFPTGKGLPTEAHGNFAFGRTFSEDEGWGRSWSPQVELLTTQAFASGEKLQWDIVPQLQVSLSSRQHILASFGGRFPLNDRGGERQPQFVFYLIWDWYDAGLLQGW